MRRALIIALIAATPALAADIPVGERRSDTGSMSRELQAMQSDETANPATLWALDGEALWARAPGAGVKSCADCHGEAPKSMHGVAARYPAFDETTGRVLDLEARIDQCRTQRQGQAPLAPDTHDMLSLAIYVAKQSAGLPIAPDDTRLASTIEKGRALFTARQGQLNLSCAICHDDNWGRKLGSSTIPQAHPTGYPIYRLEWQSAGSLQRRLRNCMVGMRAEPYAFGSDEYVALETFLMSRAKGLPVETPAVRP
jgi:sulfur-oxidizing protein SoxA